MLIMARATFTKRPKTRMNARFYVLNSQMCPQMCPLFCFHTITTDRADYPTRAGKKWRTSTRKTVDKVDRLSSSSQKTRPIAGSWWVGSFEQHEILLRPYAALRGGPPVVAMGGACVIGYGAHFSPNYAPKKTNYFDDKPPKSVPPTQILQAYFAAKQFRWKSLCQRWQKRVAKGL